MTPLASPAGSGDLARRRVGTPVRVSGGARRSPPGVKASCLEKNCLEKQALGVSAMTPVMDAVVTAATLPVRKSGLGLCFLCC